MNPKKLLYCFLFLIPFVLSPTIFTHPSTETVRVNLTQPYRLLLNNKQILQDQPTLFYNNVLYVPAKDFARELGYTVEYDNSTAVITNTELPKPSTQITPQTHLIAYLKPAFILRIP
ncbi:stalk domain-containing protein [Cellulosilyticum ruminicola]|uniref:stalk domain-containing protein n=1 Tax=Cellulosilyticum ruminicola TaxID=425254 RepID=UPI0006D1173B|nr:stalk domain-containing protein [Cellulosilyticum ruminicola]